MFLPLIYNIAEGTYLALSRDVVNAIVARGSIQKRTTMTALGPQRQNSSVLIRIVNRRAAT